jgi:hypothetical protein
VLPQDLPPPSQHICIYCFRVNLNKGKELLWSISNKFIPPFSKIEVFECLHKQVDIFYHDCAKHNLRYERDRRTFTFCLGHFPLPCIPLHFKVNVKYGVHKKLSHFDNFQHLDTNLTCHDGCLKMCCDENLQYMMIYVPIHHYVMKFMHISMIIQQNVILICKALKLNYNHNKMINKYWF